MTITQEMDSPKEIVGSKRPPGPYSIDSLPPLIVGGATFNYQYTDNPESRPITQILDLAFTSGLTAIDTSPYYGPSENLIGGALKQLESKWARESYFICTKAGRIQLNDFDYSRQAIRLSVLRSCSRLNTDYLDLVYLHDIEFVEEDQIYEALKELKLLKLEGIIRNLGITGYPIEFLYQIALGAKNNAEIGPVDAILSYSHGCIQNTKLFEFYDQLVTECQVQKIMNGSILSMSLLRSEPTHSFHPASDELKSATDQIAQELLNQGIEMADLATRFSLKHWLFGSTNKTVEEGEENLDWNQEASVVLGVSTVEELQLAVTNYWRVKLNIDDINSEDEKTFEKVKEMYGRHFNETWDSGRIKGQQRRQWAWSCHRPKPRDIN